MLSFHLLGNVFSLLMLWKRHVIDLESSFHRLLNTIGGIASGPRLFDALGSFSLFLTSSSFIVRFDLPQQFFFWWFIWTIVYGCYYNCEVLVEPGWFFMVCEGFSFLALFVSFGARLSLCKLFNCLKIQFPCRVANCLCSYSFLSASCSWRQWLSWATSFAFIDAVPISDVFR